MEKIFEINRKNINQVVNQFDNGLLEEQEIIKLFQFILDNDMKYDFSFSHSVVFDWMADLGLIHKDE
jgi:hypothetical protein